MKVRYDPDTDTLTMRLSEHPVMESDEASPGVILDYDDHGNVVGIEILKASRSWQAAGLMGVILAGKFMSPSYKYIYIYVTVL